MIWADWYKAALALVVWREARGEGSLGMLAVAHVIRNRVLSTHMDDTWDDIIEKKWQFSSMTAPGDSMLVQWPENKKDAVSFGAAMDAAEEVYKGFSVDPTGGATHYCNLSVCDPKFAHELQKLCVIGHHTFFK